MTRENDTTEKCYLVYGEGGTLTCMHNHKSGEECLALMCQYCGKLKCECFEEKENPSLLAS